jgi:hypothetical protein
VLYILKLAATEALYFLAGPSIACDQVRVPTLAPPGIRHWVNILHLVGV